MRNILVSVSLILLATAAHAELVHQFKNPAFSGIGFSSHVLTIDSIEDLLTITEQEKVYWGKRGIDPEYIYELAEEGWEEMV